MVLDGDGDMVYSVVMVEAALGGMSIRGLHYYCY
jgi:hypothetical protein